MTKEQKNTIDEAVNAFLNKNDTRRREFSIIYLDCLIRLTVSNDFYRKPNSDKRTLAIKTLLINGFTFAVFKTVSNKIFLDTRPTDSLTTKFITMICEKIKNQTDDTFTINEDITGKRLALVVNSVYHKNRYYELMNERARGGEND